MSRILNLSGRRFGRLLVHERVATSLHKQPMWRCTCDCGVERVVVGQSLRDGVSTSCGCVHGEMLVARNLRHGLATRVGAAPEYDVWSAMIARCTKPDVPGFVNYGGRGITVDPRWRDFKAFIEDIGRRPTPKHSLERRDNDGPYAPSNCYWATRREQALNTRRNRRVTFDGVTLSVTEWATVAGLGYQTLASRLHDYAWPVPLALAARSGRVRRRIGARDEAPTDAELVALRQKLAAFLAKRGAAA